MEKTIKSQGGEITVIMPTKKENRVSGSFARLIVEDSFSDTASLSLTNETVDELIAALQEAKY